MNLNYKLGFYCEKIDDTIGSHCVMSCSQDITEMLHKGLVFSSPHGCCTDLPCMNLMVRTDTMGAFQLLPVTIGHFDAKHLCTSHLLRPCPRITA